jgi:galactokinase
LQASEVKARFSDLFGAVPRIFAAPGRVNLIGEHTDYNDGFVMPAAIEFHTWVACSARSDRKVAVHSEEWKQKAEFDLDDADAAPRHHWLDYVRGVAIQLERAGHKLLGANLLIYSDVPMGAGLSSSAALEVASALAFISTERQRDASCDRLQLAKLCQRAENETVGARCGIMDQFAAANGRAGHALLLDCRSLEFKLLPLPESVSLVICNTMVAHRNVSGEYNLRRSQCEQGVKFFAAKVDGVRALRDVSLEQLHLYQNQMDKTIFRRCRHVITENRRTLDAAGALTSGDVNKFGELMYASHQSLKDDYEVSCAELNVLVELASDFSGVYGARMTGGGFGGCTINLVKKDRVSEFTANILKSYKAQTSIDAQIYVTTAADGATAVRD